MQNILLVATSLGLGSCWVGGFDKEKVKEILDLDNNIIPIGMTPIGHPTHQPPAPNRLSVDEVTHFI
jgi:nitroreductase